MLKRIVVFVIIIISAIINLQAGDTSDTVWTKNLWPDEIGDAKFTIDGNKVIVATTSNLLIIETLTGSIIKSIPIKPLTFDSQPFKIDIDEENNRFLVGALNGRVIIFDMNTFDTLQSFHLLRGLWGVSFSKDIDKIYLVYSELEQTKNVKNLIIYDLKKNQVIDSLYDEGRTVNITQNNTRDKFCSYSVIKETNWKNKIKLWDAKTNKEIKELAVFNSEIRDMAFSPDGKYLGAVGDGIITIWDTETKELFQTISNIPNECSIFKFNFSKDSKYIVYHWIGYVDNKDVYPTTIMNFKTKKVIYTYNYYAGRGLEISDDNKLILAKNGYELFMLNAKWDSSPVEENQKPNEIILYPNPANNIVNINFNVDKSDIYNISITDNKGIILEKVYSGLLDIEYHTFKWDSSKYASGIYFCKIQSKNVNTIMKIIINK